MQQKMLKLGTRMRKTTISCQRASQSGFILACTASVLLAVSCDSSEATNSEAPDFLSVIGGTEETTDVAETTGALVLHSLDSKRLVCSGVLIAPNIVLTAAHCIAKYADQEMSFTLAPALINGSSGEPGDALVVRRQVHANFRWSAEPGEPLDDIALLQLSDAVSTRHATYARGWSRLEPGAFVTLAGYGALTLDAEPSDRKARTMGPAVVSSMRVKELTIEDEVQACRGDSGGPALVRSPRGQVTAVGIASRALDSLLPCVGGSIYTRVDAYAPWIAETLALWNAGAQEAPQDAGIKDGGGLEATEASRENAAANAATSMSESARE